MRRIIFIYGLIAGAIIGGMLLLTMPLYNSGTLNFDNGELLGYSTMTIAFALIFFGVKSYRDKDLNGEISFWRAVKVGLLIYLVAAVVYALCWEVAYNSYGDSFMTKMMDHYTEQMKADGLSEEEIAKEKAEWTDFNEMYKNPVVRFCITLLEPAPVGIIVTLITAALLRRKEFLPAEPATA